MCKRALFFMVFSLCSASIVSADSTTYTITVNTSSVAGSAGSLDFQFNPGALSQAADASILAFATDGTLGAPAMTGDVTGALPGDITFDNGTALNDYFTGFTYGNALTFDVSLFGPALTSPNGTATSGSAFAFSMFSDGAGTIPALTTDTTDGFAVTVNVNLDGTTTLENFSTQTTTGKVVTTPEPGSFLLVEMGLLGLLALRSPWRRAA